MRALSRASPRIWRLYRAARQRVPHRGAVRSRGGFRALQLCRGSGAFPTPFRRLSVHLLPLAPAAASAEFEPGATASPGGHALASRSSRAPSSHAHRNVATSPTRKFRPSPIRYARCSPKGTSSPPTHPWRPPSSAHILMELAAAF